MANTSWMRSFTQRWGKYVIVPLVIAMLTGCEGKGDSSRRAFVEYLNTQIITSPVVGVCELTPAQRQAFGHYADDYDVLLAAYGQIFAVVYETGQEDKITGVIQSERDNLVFLNELRVARDVNNRFILRLKNVSSENRKKHSALKFPSDVKLVFDAAWNKTVTPLDETMIAIIFCAESGSTNWSQWASFCKNREIKSALKRMEKRFLPTWQQKNTFRINNLIFSLRRMI